MQEAKDPFSADFRIKAEISENGRRINLVWNTEESWDDIGEAVRRCKEVSGATFVSEEKSKLGQPYWHFPLEMETAKALRKKFMMHLVLGKYLRTWAKEQNKKREKLRSISQATTGKLNRLPKELPLLAEAVHLGPLGRNMTPAERRKALKGPASYQVADVAFMAHEDFNPMNCNEPGTGKTIETIAAIFEAGLGDGPNLIVAPVTSINTVWIDHLEEWQPNYAMAAIGDKINRLNVIEDARTMVLDGFPFFLVVNPDMCALVSKFTPCSEHKKARTKERRECEYCEERFEKPYPQLFDIEWNTVVLDEFHKMGIGNPDTMTARGLTALKCKKKIVLSGTPIGGKAIKIWSILHHLYPDEYASKWRFAHQWMEIKAGWGGTQTIGDDVRKEREDEFYEMLSAHMVRRTKAEVLPWLPPKQRISIWAEMDGHQRAQYQEFAEEAEIRIEDEHLSATSILAEYARLKQFAFSVQTLKRIPDHENGGEKITAYPTEESCKIPHVMAILDDLGITDNAGDEQVVIFSQFTRNINLLTKYLNEHGVKADKITGDVKEEDRSRLVREFQDGGFRVMCMNVHAGGVSITLDKASTVIFLDETWNPDDQVQAEDRVHRGSRIHQVTIYYIRTKGTIEEYIKTVTAKKTDTNFNILDARRAGLRAIMEDDE